MRFLLVLFCETEEPPLSHFQPSKYWSNTCAKLIQFHFLTAKVRKTEEKKKRWRISEKVSAINCALLWSPSDHHHHRTCAFLERQRGRLQEEASRVLHCNIQDWSMSELYFPTGCRLEAHQRDNSYVPPHTLQMSVKAFKKPQVHCLCCVT